MPTLPSTVTIAELPFYLPGDLPVWGNRIALDLAVQPELRMELEVNFDAMNAKLVSRSPLYPDIDLPGPLQGKRALTLRLVAGPALRQQYQALFQASKDPVATFTAGPKPEGAKVSPLLTLSNWERREWSATGSGDSDSDMDELESLLDFDLDSI
jgi:hypothetical protein